MRPPVVVKPHDGHQGNGVSIGLESEDDVAAAYRLAARYARTALVEEAFVGRDYRVLVVGGRVVAASERVPPFVVGDGRHTIAELVEIENRDPRRGEGHARELTRLETCPVSLASLARRGLGPESVPAAGLRVPLLETANLSKGGTARDVTDEVHPTVRRMCERAARAVGLDICGVDLVLPDIAAPVAGERAGVIELNAAPGLRMHTHPTDGCPRDVGGAIVEMLFPEGAPSRVPVVAITGTNGKTTTTRMVGAAFAEAGRTVGMTTTDGIWIGGEQVAKGDMTGSWSARLVLGDPLVEIAVLETARGGIVRRGLGWDWCDVAVMTNVQADHLGQDGVETLDDMLWVKSLVAERVREGGTLVLNADDERLASLPEHRRIARIRRTIVFFSLHERSVAVRRHRSRGGTAFFVRDGWIVEATGASERRVVEVASIPATMDGAADYNVANALGAAAACRALGLPRATVAAALARFGGPEANPGRTNLFHAGEGHVLVDYGHNADGYRVVARAARRVARGPVTGILSLPGDRLDDALVAAARVAADAFDRIVICEDEDLRGRESGEVPRLLFDAVRAERPDRECVIALDQSDALEAAVVRMRPGELVVVFYDTLSPILETLERLGATPADAPGSGAESDRMSA
jgi:cyanophycin synthetase